MIVFLTFKLLLIISFFIGNDSTNDCIKLDTTITQKIENEGFHRDIRWLFEMLSPSKEIWFHTNCRLALRLGISSGMFVNPDELAEINRTGTLHLHIDGTVDIEAPSHEASEHILYVFSNNTSINRLSINIPIHLRYQRSQITGGYGKVPLQKPSLLLWCPDSLNKICGKGLKVEAPCDETSYKTCVWKNITYEAHFDEVELFVPVGDLDDYPLVSIVTLLLGCAGCIYILSVLSTTPI